MEDGSSYQDFIQRIHPKKPRWIEKLYAKFMNSFSGSGFDKDTAKLFSQIDGRARTVLEVGIGTGVNFKYLSGRNDLKITGVDPNKSMEKYAVNSLVAAGFRGDQFEFIHGVGEKIPLESSSIDVVISTLVLCSVTDVSSTMQGIQKCIDRRKIRFSSFFSSLTEVIRVLKPGGQFLFVEHVGAQGKISFSFPCFHDLWMDPDGSWLNLFQNLLNPIQVFVADGCHLNRDTLSFIRKARFSSIDARSYRFPSKNPLISSYIVGVARK
ncbi:methyltransferase-like protein 7B isoform X1 [Selaginella moellendorffii]|uniref:methyltransferase-like protein 7B isoform X1 n=1 Tax=Selaginella moellendorffii TaxID=88036 RepID=UPI000D1C5F1D|nr:methyltransferase-like protein 7B isoform X1 [Selaginella moellendorffii]|eukprot:XP_024532601.1 methyltransferase-like protein 7B isoform X1 [Selaginella moellendorffii]